LLDAASLSINRLCGRPDGFVALTTATARIYAGSGTGVQDIDECTEVTLVAVKESITDTTYTSWAATDWVAASGSIYDPDFNTTPYTLLLTLPSGDYAVFTSGKYTTKEGFPPDLDARNQRSRGLPTVQVTAKWGFATTCPTDIREAALMQATRWYQRYRAGMADTVANAELGQLLYRQQLDPDVAQILIAGGYKRQMV
jgi:hypothetical protein